ncbi:uncharacterized protein C18orf63 homolog isoform X3 [Siphateles boraxobius]|uniref:uncharacterized protein C18orf63 homolog isoform X3 n=1 Tax=Siphateles boraxobius TaxID=180520 RepID=UPI0040645199
MSGRGTQSLFFLSVPDLRNLCCVNLFFPKIYDEGELRNKQLKTCRELVLSHSDVVASPLLGHCGGITVIMTLNLPQRVFPAILQTCLSYSVTAKLAPKWNKAGQYLIAGKDFLSDSGKLNAVVLELSITETQLCVSVEANTVRLAPAVINDFDIPAPVVKSFLQTDNAVLHTVMPNNWCHVLPRCVSLKKGQIISISRRIPQESPFQSYTELQKHWNYMYGYQLPSVSEEEVIYCSVYFKLIGDKPFTYPLCCIRTQPVQCFPRVDLQGVLGSFTSDLQAVLESVCGFSAWITCKPCYYSNELKRPVTQSSEALPVNVTTENSSRAVLNQLPSRCPRDTAENHNSQCDSTGKHTEKKERPRSLDHKDWTSSNLATLSSSSSTNVHFTHIQSQSTLPRPRLVPIFKNKSYTHRMNVTEILVKEQKLKAVIKPLSPTCLSSSFTPPARSNQFSGPPAPGRMSLPFFKSKEKTNRVDRILPPLPLVQTQTQTLPEIPSKRGGDKFESKPKKPKQSVQDVCVEVYATNNQLSKVKAVTLQAWLKSRGISVSAKDKKEMLVSKVMQCLNET